MKRFILTAALAAAFVGTPALARADEAPKNDVFGVAKPMSVEKAKAMSMAWLKDAKADAIVLEKANAIWDDKSDRPVLDRVAETLLLGSNDQVREIIDAARDPNLPAPLKVPAMFVDEKNSKFFRANLGLYFAKHMAARRVYAECLATLKAFSPEDTVDPSTYYFFQAVAANKLLIKPESVKAIDKLMADVDAVPERYAVVATLMRLEMSLWKENDLGDIARRMKQVEDLLENARHGEVTIKTEDEIVKMLAKMIEDLEKEKEGQPGPPMPGDPKGIKSSAPAQDSKPAQGEGEGNVDTKALVKDLKLWGKLPEKERIQAFEAIKKEYPPHITEAIRGFLVKGRLLPESPR